MGLDKTTLKTNLQSLFEDTTEGNTAEQKATALADLVDAYVKTALVKATVPGGKFVVSAVIPTGVCAVSGTAIAQANLAPIPVTLTFDVAPLTIQGDPTVAPATANYGGLS